MMALTLILGPHQQPECWIAGAALGEKVQEIPLRHECDETAMDRSQAKRVLARIERFTEVILDFNGVSEVGQGFVDEIFRVFSQNHPEVHLFYVNANESIEWMIRRSLASSKLNGFKI